MTWFWFALSCLASIGVFDVPDMAFYAARYLRRKYRQQRAIWREILKGDKSC